MCKLLSYFLMFFYLTVSSSNSSSLHAAEMELEKTTAQQLIEKMKNTKTDVCVIGFNVGRANCFLHINKTNKDMFVIDCGYQKNSHYAQKIVDIIEGFCNFEFNLTAIIITHWDNDHYNLLDVPCHRNNNVFQYLKSKRPAWIVPEYSCQEKYQSSNFVSNTDSFKYPANGNSRVFSIPVIGSSKDVNGSSLVIHIDGVVYPGDINSGKLKIATTGQFRGVVFPHHGSVTGTSRDVRNQIIDQMVSNAARFVLISNDNRTNCKLGVGMNTPMKIGGTAPKPFSMIGVNSKNPNRTSTPTKQNVGKDEVSANFIFTSDNENAIAQCVMFNSNILHNPKAYRFMITQSNNVETSPKHGIHELTQSMPGNLKDDAAKIDDAE